MVFQKVVSNELVPPLTPEIGAARANKLTGLFFSGGLARVRAQWQPGVADARFTRRPRRRSDLLGADALIRRGPRLQRLGAHPEARIAAVLPVLNTDRARREGPFDHG